MYNVTVRRLLCHR